MASAHSTSFSASETSISRSREGDQLIEIRRTVCYTTELSSSPLGDNHNSRRRSKSLQRDYQPLENERHTVNTATDRELHHPHLQTDSPSGNNDNSRSRSKPPQGDYQPLEKELRHTVNTATDRELHHPHLQTDPPRSAVSAPPSLSPFPGGHEATRLHSNTPKCASPSPSSSWPRRKILFYHKYEPYYGFTNFSPHPVSYNEKSYPTSEHLFQSFKFNHRPNLAEHIRTCDSRPSKAFSEARRFQPEVRSDWKQVNIPMMDVVLWHKFNQHQDLRDELLSTGNAELVENSDQDAFWGIGSDGKGKNELGKALQRLRTRLRTPGQTT